jgi:23S rRNA pseudouridine2457 synthase
MKYYIIYKPYKMISQFTSEDSKKESLAGIKFEFPKNVYPLGRLDENSEGLLLLSDDKKLNHLLLNPEFEHSRIYRVQVQGIITNAALKQLAAGVEIALTSGAYMTKPCKAKQLKKPEGLPDRQHPISSRLPTSWIELTLTEGKFHQVRKMTAGVGFPCLRLIRIAIEDVRLETMQPGEVRELKKEMLYKKLKIDA